LKRGSQRAALDQFWTTQGANNLALTSIGICAEHVKSDGADLWVANRCSNTVSRIRASDGKLLETWTGANIAGAVLCAMGKVFVTGRTNPTGNLYQIDPKQPAGSVTLVSSELGEDPNGIAFDGQRIWTVSNGIVTGIASVSIITLNPTVVTNITTGFSSPYGILYDGANIWVADTGDDMLKKLDSSGAILQSIPMGHFPRFPAFDGTNIWVPNQSDHSVSVVRASIGTVVATLTGNGMFGPLTAAFDGERIIVTNYNGNSVSLWKAADLTPLGSFSTGPNSVPYGVCSDGLNFWITLQGTHKLARF
jgi:hypothetical protein